jgi:hypothetical protein
MHKTTKYELVDRIVFSFVKMGSVCVVYSMLFQLDVLWCEFALQESKMMV